MAKRFEKAREYTEKYKSLLLPCRICGNKEIIITSDILLSKYVWSITCTTKSCDYYSDVSVKNAIKKWNERQSKRK